MFQPQPSRPVKHPLEGASHGNRTRRLSLATALALALMAPVLHAQELPSNDSYREVSRLLRAGQFNEALGKADQYLATKPRDPQMRFIKGVIQSESGKSSEAIATFSKLTEEFPELPEPYNNLAVLYAAQGQFDKARSVLEMAIRTNPSYATAHENLGDVYARLASQAYSKALQLDAGNTGVTPKLSLIRSLFSKETKKERPQTAAPEPAAEVKPPTKPTPPSAVAVVTPPSAEPSPTPAAPSPDVKNEVQAAVLGWAKAWSSKDMRGYLGAYASGFTPPSGQTRSAWEADRKARIVPRARIDVEIKDLAITVNPESNRATARFRQIYSSDTINVTSRKSLDMVKVGTRWQILRESTGS